MSNAYLTLSGADLRAKASAGDAAAKAELDRRIAKRQASGKVTVAALRSWGRTTEADAIVAHAKETKPVKAPKTPKAEVAKVAPKSAAFTRTSEVVEAPKSAIGHLHNRMVGLEKAVLAMASAQAAQHEAISLIAKKLGC